MRKKLKKKPKIFEIFVDFSWYPESRIVPKNVKEGPLGVFEHPFFCKIEKIEGGPFGDIEKICEKVSKSRNNLHKKCLVKGGTRTHVLLLGRSLKILKKSEAEEATLVWQLVEASL